MKIICFATAALLLFIIALPQGEGARGTVYLKLISYRNPSSRAAKGKYCDSFWSKRTSACDPYFKVCLGYKSGRCSIGSITTSHTDNRDNLYFGSTIGKRRTRNPISFRFNNMPYRFVIRVDAIDHDKFSRKDDIDTLVGKVSRVTTRAQTIRLTHRTNMVAKIWVRCYGYYYGPSCARTNYCARRPCRNGGKCVNTSRRFTCHCPVGWTGIYCTSRVNFCRNRPCTNGGRCVNRARSYTCHCSKYFGGRRCERRVGCPKPNYHIWECRWKNGKPTYHYQATVYTLRRGRCVPQKKFISWKGHHKHLKCPKPKNYKGK